MTTIEREFLNWDSHCLHQAARWLDQRYSQDRAWDLRPVTIVVPGRRSGRRLLEVLVEHASDRVFVPPRIVTAGELPEQLYESADPVADPLQATLARVASLRQAPQKLLNAVAPHPPTHDDWTGWLALAQDLATLDDHLAGDAVKTVQVIEKCSTMPNFADHHRWQALAQLRHDYEQLLKTCNLQDLNTARFAAVSQNRCATDQHIVLLATADLFRLTQIMLRQVAAHSPVISLIHAPPSRADDFDDLGCVITHRWADRHLHLNPSSVRVVDHPRDQAFEALRVIGQYASHDHAPIRTDHAPAHAPDTPDNATSKKTISPKEHISPDQITIGMGDESLAPLLQRSFEIVAVPARSATQHAVTRSRPAMLIDAISQYTRHPGGPRFDDLANLLRHPDLELYLHDRLGRDEAEHAVTSWLTLLDHYATKHVQGQITQTWLGRTAPQLKALHDAVTELLPEDPATAQPLPHWSGPIAHALQAVYSRTNLNRYDPQHADLIRALEVIAYALRQQADLDPHSPVTPSVTLADAIDLTLARVADQHLPVQGGPPAIELLGWLELHLDDAPVLIVTGMNEGLVPQSASSDAFLPDATRQHLGLQDNEHRYARDLMMLTAIIASREHVTLIAARRDHDDNPLVPSRLLLATDDAKLRTMIERFYSHAADSPAQPILLQHSQHTRFDVPKPQPIHPPITQLSITDFHDYLACPYRFYLQHVLKLRVVDDQAVELDAMRFGSLAHDVLKRFSQSDFAHSTDANQIAVYLDTQLDELMLDRFSQSPRVAVQMQCRQLRLRLAQFASLQADLTAEGWLINSQHAEIALHTTLDVDGQPFKIVGRIDRIDTHPNLGHRIIDYKTGDTATAPDKAHRAGPKQNKHWVDLQLPLYQLLAKKLDIKTNVELGYFSLSKDSAKLDIAPWADADLQLAYETARQVIRDIRASKFWPPSKTYPPRHDDYAAICMVGCHDSPALATDPATQEGGLP